MPRVWARDWTNWTSPTAWRFRARDGPALEQPIFSALGARRPKATSYWPPRTRAASGVGLRHQLGDQVGLKGVRAAFRAISRIPDASEGQLGQREAEMIDRDHARLDLVA